MDRHEKLLISDVIDLVTIIKMSKHVIRDE